jgi:hypothetical protein
MVDIAFITVYYLASAIRNKLASVEISRLKTEGQHQIPQPIKNSLL